MPNTRSLKERVGSLKNLRPFIAMVWRTSPQLTPASLAIRFIRALLPIATRLVGKLIIDDVVLLAQGPTKPSRLQQWLQSGLLNPQGLLLAAEFSLAVMADVLGRIVSLVDGLLWEHVTNASSVRLTERGAVPAYDRLCAEGVRARLWHSHSSGTHVDPGARGFHNPLCLVPLLQLEAERVSAKGNLLQLKRNKASRVTLNGGLVCICRHGLVIKCSALTLTTDTARHSSDERHCHFSCPWRHRQQRPQREFRNGYDLSSHRHHP